MKLTEFLKNLQNDSEYQEIEKKYQLQLDIADAVLRARINKNWSQSELARRVGTRQANISRLEAGLANPTIKFLQKVADALDIEISIRIGEHDYLNQAMVVDKRAENL